MSWEAHTNHVIAQSGNTVEYLGLFGPGSCWADSGKHGRITSCDVDSVCKTPAGGLKVDGQKYMFLREMEDDGFKLYAYNKSGKGAAVLVGKQYRLVAIAADGYKAEHCMANLRKGQVYLQGIGYN